MHRKNSSLNTILNFKPYSWFSATPQRRILDEHTYIVQEPHAFQKTYVCISRTQGPAQEYRKGIKGQPREFEGPGPKLNLHTFWNPNPTCGNCTHFADVWQTALFPCFRMRRAVSIPPTANRRSELNYRMFVCFFRPFRLVCSFRDTKNVNL